MGCGSSEAKAVAPQKGVKKESHVNWAALKKKLPPLDNSAESKAARKSIFDKVSALHGRETESTSRCGPV